MREYCHATVVIIYKKVERKVKKIRANEKRITVEIRNGWICNKTRKVPGSTCVLRRV